MKKADIFCCPPTGEEKHRDTEKNFTSLMDAVNAMAEKYDMPIFGTLATQEAQSTLKNEVLFLTRELNSTSPWASTITIICR